MFGNIVKIKPRTLRTVDTTFPVYGSIQYESGAPIFFCFATNGILSLMYGTLCLVRLRQHAKPMKRMISASIAIKAMNHTSWYTGRSDDDGPTVGVPPVTPPGGKNTCV